MLPHKKSRGSRQNVTEKMVMTHNRFYKLPAANGLHEGEIRESPRLLLPSVRAAARAFIDAASAGMIELQCIVRLSIDHAGMANIPNRFLRHKLPEAERFHNGA